MLASLFDYRSSQFRGIVAAIATISAVGLAISLSIPLLSFEMERRGISATFIGLNVATYGLAALIVTPFIASIAHRFGFFQIMMAAIVTNALTFIGFYYTPDFWMWFPLRFVGGVSVAILFVLSEFWINAIAPEKQRGIIIGIYATVLSLGFAGGPLILTISGTTGLLPYAVGALLMLTSAIPLIFAHRDGPDMGQKSSTSFVQFLFLAPVATGAALLFGALESGAFALLPIYGLRLGFETKIVIFLASVMTLGNVLFQIPIGLISDKIDRRKLLLIFSAITILGAIAIPIASNSISAIMALLFIWGGLTGGLYTVGLAHLGSRFSGSDLANANSAFIFCYALGMLVGPAVMGAGMDVWNPHGFAAVITLFASLYAVLCFYRIAVKPTG